MSNGAQSADIIEQIRTALGMDEGEKLVVQTPQFERHDGVQPGDPPLTKEAMDQLKQIEKSELEGLGLRKWSDETGLWLLPYEWHPHLPPEYPLVSILDEETCRSEMPANPDKRLGVLSVGIIPEFERSQDTATDRQEADSDV